MDEMVNELNVEISKIGSEMNMSKTQVMLNHCCDTGTIEVAGKALERLESYVYLGRELIMTNNTALEIDRRRRSSWAAFGSIREMHLAKAFERNCWTLQQGKAPTYKTNMIQINAKERPRFHDTERRQTSEAHLVKVSDVNDNHA
ncbi:hypothetical protein TELCIR_03166 [Teladorsagia circumcincta]|uniref:Uncharacterized protein n=1 Tax=Teladorsagia circumcincta TaxID=45464 RepID=A0A2G9UX22_TELCI|nr:hypothetical protein TELCIR_03166 [Teladorsagia circumcincta]